MVRFCSTKDIHTLTDILILNHSVHIILPRLSVPLDNSVLVQTCLHLWLTTSSCLVFLFCCLILTSSGKFHFKIWCFSMNTSTFGMSPSFLSQIFFLSSFSDIISLFSISLPFFNYLYKLFHPLLVILFLCRLCSLFHFAPTRSLPCLFHPILAFHIILSLPEASASWTDPRFQLRD